MIQFIDQINELIVSDNISNNRIYKKNRGLQLNGKKLTAVSIPLVLAAVLISSCVGLDNTYMYIQYEAYYDTPLDIDAIENILTKENITYKMINTYTHILSFSYGQDFNNASVEPTSCILYPNHIVDNYHANLNIELDGSKYPRPHWTEDTNKINEIRKPILGESMNYITDLIYQATGLTPVHKEFNTGDGAQID